MIHQYIFAGPKPGLSAEAFQSYWLNFHAVDFAAKIPQIERYLVATRLNLNLPRQVPFFEGIAEIWLKDAESQIASLQSPEFLQGARVDEPRWAAFWQTLVMDTEPVVVRQSDPSASYTKIYTLLKRARGTTLDDFRAKLTGDHARSLSGLPGLEGHVMGFAPAGWYALGEPRFDAIDVWSFESPPVAENAAKSPAFAEAAESWSTMADPRYIFSFAGQENWIIRDRTTQNPQK